MFKGKIQTFQNSFGIAGWGNNFRSKKILFLTSLLNHFGHERKGLRNKVAGMIAGMSAGKEVEVTLHSQKIKPFPVKYRLNDFSDYQSLGECLGTMYEMPGYPLDYFIDAGANIGFFSINMLCKNNFTEAVLIEPNPDNLELLRYNTRAFSAARILPYALSKTDGAVVFELATSNTGHIKGAIGHTQTEKNVLVESKVLSTIIPLSWAMDKTLLKLDIEGAEYDVIGDLIANNIFPKIIVGEIHDYLRQNGVGLVKDLELAGYEVKVTGSGNEGNVCRQIVAVHSNTARIR